MAAQKRKLQQYLTLEEDRLCERDGGHQDIFHGMHVLSFFPTELIARFCSF